MKRSPPLVKGQYYHIYNRGALKQTIFREDYDYLRWKNLLEWYLHFDYTYSMFLKRKRIAERKGQPPGLIREQIARLHKIKEKLVEVNSWTALPNHFHLTLKQLCENGISKYLQKISNAYSHYFNRKYKSSGSVFQGRFKSVLIETDEQLIHVCRYVHINPPTAGIITKDDLQNYPWSSLQTFLNNEPDNITDKSLLLDYFGSIKKLKDFTMAQIKEEEIATLDGLTIDDDFGWYKTKNKRAS